MPENNDNLDRLGKDEERLGERLDDRMDATRRDLGEREERITLSEWAASIGCCDVDAVLAIAGRVELRHTGA